ncbi:MULTISPECIES: DUF2442 domain-containing protein [Methylomonas]|uniref:Uncharacterized protein n=1 Tax=Methylomonas koyamae TaxID=702114 RepID=A0A291IH83_9GAMM|nr:MULTISPECIES: DUF2442 domain-containing protein [Methylomonas]ANE54850.1 hypothetical protein AYM39_06420 [Methylomonas sp. DH-1]ATG89558.1 hypothetical protein MKLM6_1302 [Methylomonas koyamae]OAI23440.1 hypothetical protein A1356_01400 [Methylomonas koyamae]TPQ24375.1 DUF2442 domain-containing protein [Methylomonas koyamae]WNB74753.1 DUF2442 domain-containing protein [Methylomonas koyamae]
MILHVTDVQYLQNYQLKLTFNDGVAGVVDLSNELWGEMFEPLKDTQLFSQVKLDKELDTIVWANGADLAPEFLRNLIQPA